MQPRIPPCNIDAEQWVLGGLLLAPESADEVFGLLAAGDFYRADHRLIFEGVLHLVHKHKSLDLVTLTSHLRDAGQLEHCGGMSYIGSLANDTPSAINIIAHAKLVFEASKRRKLIALAGSIAEAAYTQDHESLQVTMTQGLEALSRGTCASAKQFVELYADAQNSIELAISRRKSGRMPGVASGMPAFDKRTGGFCRKRLYGVAARPGCGKTALLNQIGVHATRNGHPGLICSLEMGGEELVIRALANHSGANVTRIGMGADKDVERAFNACNDLSEIPLWIDTETYSLNGILGQIAAHKHKHGIEWAAIDHIGLVETQRFSSRNDQIGFITRSLKQAAKRHDIAIIALSQLSRNSETMNRRPGLHDLRDSGNIEQDLDAALFLHIDQDKRNAQVKPLNLGLLKNRSGVVGWFSESIEFDGQTQRIREVSTVDESVPQWQRDRDAA